MSALLDSNGSQFNFMAYDIYGTWDATISSIGSRVYASTNMTMIESGLKLLWHNNIEASKVNLGLGLYGRSMFSCCLSFDNHFNTIRLYP